MRRRLQGPVAKDAAILVGVVLLFALVAGLAWVARGTERRGQASAAQVLRAGWRAQNLQGLLRLSTAGEMSADEQARFDGAADDPERMRQVLIDVHEERLANAGRDLEDAQQRKIDLQGGGGYQVYSDQPEGKDLVALANQDEWAATSAVAQYADGLQAIRAWTPVTYQAYAAAVARGTAPTLAMQRAPAPPIRSKPDPRVPMPSASTESAPVRVAAPVRRALPSDVPSVQHEPSTPKAPSIAGATEAGRPAPIVREGAAPGRSEDDSSGSKDTDLAVKERSEAQIRQVLGRWAQAMTLNNPQAEAAEYAPHLDRYFLRTDVDRAFVQADKAAYLRRGNLTAGFAIEAVTIENETADAADVRLVKDVTWNRSTTGVTHKLIRSRLHLVRTGEGWKIAGEQDFR